MHRGFSASICALGLSWAHGLAGCAVPVENSAAYDSERFLCAAEHSGEWQAEVDRCRAGYELDKSCGGVISFSGRLEGELLTVDAALGANEFLDLVNADGSEVRQDIKLYGRSPYFLFVLRWKELGGDLLGGAEERSLSIGGSSGPIAGLDDDVAVASLRLTVGGDSRSFLSHAGDLTIERQAPDEQAATFSADFGTTGDHLDGCFHAFAVEHKFTRIENTEAR